ncbi:MAG: hypothetical protein ACHP84_15845 [Caulobacterales bacterium]|jgi:hypothetical protein
MLLKIGDVYKPGETVPVSGLYRVKHFQVHATEHEVTCVRGERFAACSGCGDYPRFTLVKPAPHLTENEHFR